MFKIHCAVYYLSLGCIYPNIDKSETLHRCYNLRWSGGDFILGQLMKNQLCSHVTLFLEVQVLGGRFECFVGQARSGLPIPSLLSLIT